MLLGVTLAGAATAAALLVDCSLSSWCVAAHYPGLLKELLTIAEPFGHGLGVLLIGVLIYLLDPRRRPLLARVMVMSLGAGLMADGLKLLIARTRPRVFSFEGGVAETFGGWLPLLGSGSHQQSFPSAHAATAAGLAIALVWVYPRGRWLFASLAVLVVCQRIASGNHYLSDTVFGAAIGVLVAHGCLSNPWVAQRFERLEAFLESGRVRASKPAERVDEAVATSTSHY